VREDLGARLFGVQQIDHEGRTRRAMRARAALRQVFTQTVADARNHRHGTLRVGGLAPERQGCDPDPA
jgi:hypothetical protein